jgi:hypothetical protein
VLRCCGVAVLRCCGVAVLRCYGVTVFGVTDFNTKGTHSTRRLTQGRLRITKITKRHAILRVPILARNCRQKSPNRFEFSLVGFMTSTWEGLKLNKHILWVIPVGVAAGISLPLLVPAKKAPAPPPTVHPTPLVSVEGFELKRRIPQPVAVPAPGLVADQSDGLGSLASSPVLPVTEPAVRTRKRWRPRLDSRAMRKIQTEDSRAWEAANRMLMYERKT